MRTLRLFRRKGTPCETLKLDEAHWTDDPLLDLLPNPQRGAFNKEDGEAVVDAEGRRVVR